MKAILVYENGTPPVLSTDLPAPQPGAREITVRVHASSVNPVDIAIARGLLEDMYEHAYPITLGRDYAGTVEQVGADVADFSTGDQVFGFLPAARPVVRDGAWAERIVVPVGAVALKPAHTDWASAGASPLATVTATTAIDALALFPGNTLMIVGATGGVGSLAVQLAADAGAEVIAPALPEDEQYLHNLGVSKLLPRDGDVIAAAREHQPDGVDALLDNVSFQPGSYDAALKPDGRVASPNRAAGEGPGRTNVQPIPSAENLQRVARLLDAGTIKVHIQRTYTVGEAADAMHALHTQHSQGKLAIEL